MTTHDSACSSNEGRAFIEGTVFFRTFKATSKPVGLQINADLVSRQPKVSLLSLRKPFFVGVPEPTRTRPWWGRMHAASVLRRLEDLALYFAASVFRRLEDLALYFAAVNTADHDNSGVWHYTMWRWHCTVRRSTPPTRATQACP